MSQPSHGTLHHIELWVPYLHRADASLVWLLEALTLFCLRQYVMESGTPAGVGSRRSISNLCCS
jgi:hypothetical protein